MIEVSSTVAMKIYWAVTIPLTAAVVVAWLLWSRMHRRRDDAADKASQLGMKEKSA